MLWGIIIFISTYISLQFVIHVHITEIKASSRKHVRGYRWRDWGHTTTRWTTPPTVPPPRGNVFSPFWCQHSGDTLFWNVLFCVADCRVSDWSTWSECICDNGVCGNCARSRSTYLLQTCANGGDCNCKAEIEKDPCNMPCRTFLI